jgi:outer membrane protein
MKNLSLILNIILLLAVAYLFVDRFGSAAKPDAGKQEMANTGEARSEQAPRIVYINIDSLHKKSEKFQTKKAELEKQQANAEAALKAKGRTFENEVAAYQKKIQSGNITPKEAQEIEQRLAMQEQSFAKEQERLAKSLMTETDKFNENFTNEIRTYLDSLKLAKGYDYVLLFGAGSPVLVASDSLDITNNVLELLNKKQ